MTARRIATTAGAAGLVAGLALGVNGLATAAGGGSSDKAANGASGSTVGRHFRGGHAEALVVSVTSGNLVVRTPAGIRTITLTAGTRYFDGQTAATRTVVRPGELVSLRLTDPRATTPVAAAVRIVPAHLAGYVTAVSGGTLTVLDQGGFSRTVTTTASTVIRKDGKAASLGALTVGSFVRAGGRAVGTDLAASRIGTGRPAAGDRMGMLGRHRMGSGPAGSAAPAGAAPAGRAGDLADDDAGADAGLQG